MRIAVITGVFAITALAVFLANLPVGQSPSPSQTQAPAASERVIEPQPPALPPATADVPGKSDATAASPDAEVALEPTLQKIEDLAITYDVAAIPALAAYLAHADPRVREAAREGLIILGEDEAVPYLKAAAQKAPPEEGPLLKEAAEFLALPSITDFRRKSMSTDGE